MSSPADFNAHRLTSGYKATEGSTRKITQNLTDKGQVKDLMALLDKMGNKDGKVSFDEFTNGTAFMENKIEEDGALSRMEVLLRASMGQLQSDFEKLAGADSVLELGEVDSNWEANATARKAAQTAKRATVLTVLNNPALVTSFKTLNDASMVDNVKVMKDAAKDNPLGMSALMMASRLAMNSTGVVTKGSLQLALTNASRSGSVGSEVLPALRFLVDNFNSVARLSRSTTVGGARNSVLTLDVSDLRKLNETRLTKAQAALTEATEDITAEKAAMQADIDTAAALLPSAFQTALTALTTATTTKETATTTNTAALKTKAEAEAAKKAAQDEYIAAITAGAAADVQAAKLATFNAKTADATAAGAAADTASTQLQVANADHTAKQTAYNAAKTALSASDQVNLGKLEALRTQFASAKLEQETFIKDLQADIDAATNL